MVTTEEGVCSTQQQCDAMEYTDQHHDVKESNDHTCVTLTPYIKGPPGIIYHIKHC